jgi:hypothetical protein
MISIMFTKVIEHSRTTMYILPTIRREGHDLDDFDHVHKSDEPQCSHLLDPHKISQMSIQRYDSSVSSMKQPHQQQQWLSSSLGMASSFIMMCTMIVMMISQLEVVLGQSDTTTTTPLLPCTYLPIGDDAPMIEFDLPSDALRNPLDDLPIEFRGVQPIVTRRQLAFGSRPKVRIERYSSTPTIEYDETTQMVIISSAGCSSMTADAEDGSSSSGSGSSRGSWIHAMTTSGIFSAAWASTMIDPQLRPWVGVAALLSGMSSSISSVEAVVHTRVASSSSHESKQNMFPRPVRRDLQQDTCIPTVKVIVEAPAAYRGAVEVCLDEINDSAICPDPFPTYATCDDPAPACGVAVIGAGAGGLYTALRYAHILHLLLLLFIF